MIFVLNCLRVITVFDVSAHNLELFSRSLGSCNFTSLSQFGDFPRLITSSGEGLNQLTA